MNHLLAYVYFYQLLASSAFPMLPEITETTTGIALFHPESDSITSTTKSTTRTIVVQVGEKDIKQFLKKVFDTAILPSPIALITEHKARKDNDTISVVAHSGTQNSPERYTGPNRIISGLCPYFVAGGGFNIEKMAADYWPRFYNMKNTLECFKISVVELTEEEMQANEDTFGSFGGRVNWKQCHFEIKPRRKTTDTRHFLLGDVYDMGVMRNIHVTTNENGDVSLEEESPDQWLMLKKMVILRDCTTGEVVVFTTSPLTTTADDVTEVLHELDEDMTGHLLCNKDEVRAAQDSVS